MKYQCKLSYFQAALLNRLDQINLLIMYGADVNALALARPRPSSPSLPALPKRTSKLTSQSQVGLQHRIVGSGGETPLHFAAIAGQMEAARRLLEWGADPQITNEHGHTPMEEALCNNHHDIAHMIRNFRGDQSQRSSCK